MSGASRHWPDVRVEMAMDVLSCRITGREARDRSIRCMLSIPEVNFDCHSLNVLFWEISVLQQPLDTGL